MKNRTWTTKQKDQLEVWAKMLGESLKNQTVISKGSSYHYVKKKK